MSEEKVEVQKAACGMVVSQAKELGFTAAVLNVEEAAVLKKKLTVAYERYRYVTSEQIQAFNTKLRQLSENLAQGQYHYQELVLTPTEKYPAIPPAEVLEKLAEAKGLQVFDSYEVAHIVAQVEVKDPILFGRVKGCGDRFIIAQWDDDVKVSDLIGELEG